MSNFVQVFSAAILFLVDYWWSSGLWWVNCRNENGGGKTLVCTVAAYLNALTGEGVHGIYFYVQNLLVFITPLPTYLTDVYD